MDYHFFFTDALHFGLLLLFLFVLGKLIESTYRLGALIGLVVFKLICAVLSYLWRGMKWVFTGILFAFLMLFPFFRKIAKREILLRLKKRDEFSVELEGSHFDAVNRTFNNPYKTNPDRPF